MCVPAILAPSYAIVRGRIGCWMPTCNMHDTVAMRHSMGEILFVGRSPGLKHARKAAAKTALTTGSLLIERRLHGFRIFTCRKKRWHLGSGHRVEYSLEGVGCPTNLQFALAFIERHLPPPNNGRKRQWERMRVV